MTRRCIAPALLACTLACNPDPVPSIDLDLSASCARAEITTVIDAVLDDGYVVHQVAMDAPDASDGWVLVTLTDEGAPNPIRVVRVSDTTQEVILYGAVDPEELSLHPGAVAGEAWVLERGDTALRALRLDASAPGSLIGQNDNLLNFPIPGTDDWARELIFLGGQPHLAALEPTSDDDGNRLFIGRFDSALVLSSSWELRFEDPCDPDLPDDDIIACEANKATLSYRDITIVHGSPDPRAPTARLALTRTLLRDQIEEGDELVLISLSRLGGGMPAGVLRDISSGELFTPPFSVAVDDFAAYLAHDSPWQTLVWRLDDLATAAIFLGLGLELSPPGSRLVQMDGDLGLGRIQGGDFVFTKIFADAPSFSQLTIHEAPSSGAYNDFAAAGPGHVLLRSNERRPQVARITCAVDGGELGGGAEVPPPDPQP